MSKERPLCPVLGGAGGGGGFGRGVTHSHSLLTTSEEGVTSIVLLEGEAKGKFLLKVWVPRSPPGDCMLLRAVPQCCVSVFLFLAAA